MLAEILFESGPIPDVGAVVIFKVLKFRDQSVFQMAFG